MGFVVHSAWGLIASDMNTYHRASYCDGVTGYVGPRGNVSQYC